MFDEDGKVHDGSSLTRASPATSPPQVGRVVAGAGGRRWTRCGVGGLFDRVLRCCHLSVTRWPSETRTVKAVPSTRARESPRGRFTHRVAPPLTAAVVGRAGRRGALA